MGLTDKFTDLTDQAKADADVGDLQSSAPEQVPDATAAAHVAARPAE